MDMIRHDDKRIELIMPELHSTQQRVYYQFRNRVLVKKNRSVAGEIQKAIHPDKGFSRRSFPGRRITSLRKAAVQAPCDEEPTALWVDMREAAASGHLQLVSANRLNSQLYTRNKRR